MTNIFKVVLLLVFSCANASNYNYAYKVLLKYEGIIYHDNPKDPGGPTKYGWTLKTYRQTISQKATKKDIKHLSESQAKILYKKYWWEKYKASKIKDKKLATVLFLAQVNMGPTRPNKVLQEISNDLCDTNLSVDGVLGEQSLKAINSCHRIPDGYPYYLHLTYLNDPNISPVWYWAKKGLRNRIFHVH
jgi:lysozyme family protein